MRRITLSWEPLGLSVTAELDGRNPQLAEAIWQALPYQSLQGHALVAGHHLYHLAPVHELVHTPGTECIDRRTAPNGTVFGSALQHLGIKYGSLTEPMAASPIGRVHEADLPLLSQVGRAVWEATYHTKKAITVEVRRAGEPGGHRIPRLHAADPRVDRLITDIFAATEHDWLTPPAELVDLHDGRIASGAGSFDTVLTTLLFVNGETRPLGYAGYGALVRAAANGDVPAEQLHQFARLLVPVPAEFLGYCGLERLWSFTQRLLDVLDQPLSRSDFQALMSHMAMYVNCLGGWNLQLFPWDVGHHLRQETGTRHG
ncbi:hypothetical protein [Nocardia brevicatena]|uniref:cucumopine synthase-related protein n=1 Tax=Nocardia brevicatena TaxID=37327 RepID=UPI0002E7CF53|nr:hypothetical protein [Nocardia brevicatena]